MKHKNITWSDLGVTAEIGAFTPEDGVAEWHVILHARPHGELFAGQLARLCAAERLLMTEGECAGASLVMKRYFLSDSTNQVPLMRVSGADGRGKEAAAVSCIQQPPLDGSKVAVWLYLQRGTVVRRDGSLVMTDHNGYRHLWTMGMTRSHGISFTQTTDLLCEYEEMLACHGATLADNCIRTWFFVRDVDTQYEGMVKARLANFFDQGLTPQTHYIASTGIQGLPADTRALIQLSAYAVTGLVPGQQRHLYALDHLNRTIEYGVTFERGTLVEYGDRGHAWISGTASINDKGEVVHVGDIVRQTLRMWENVEALLAEAGMTMADCAMIIVYLRDVGDYEVVRNMFAEHYPDIPTVFTLAPVCRPSWLIEMECVGIAERDNPEYKNL